MGQLNDKIALVTGGTSGIGLAAAKRLAAEGAHVFITGRDKGRLDEALASIGPSANGICGDVTDPDVVFTNAGGGEFAPLADMTPQHFLDTFNRNVGGTIFTVQKVLPFLNTGASVILSGSSSA